MRFGSIAELVSSKDVDLGETDWVTITQDDVNDFARSTRASEWIHTDVDRAKRESPFGATVVHGYLTLSLATHFITSVLSVPGLSVGVNYGLERVRFPAPLPVGSKVRASARLVEARRFGDGVRTAVDLTYEAEGLHKPPCVARVLSVILP